MTLRVAHVLNGCGYGGVPRVVHALIRHSDPARVAPHVFFLKAGTGADPFAGTNVPRRIARSSSKATAMTDLVAWLDRHRIDIMHTHSFRPNLYGRMAGAVLRPTGLKIVAHYHNEYGDKWHGAALILERRLAALTDAAVAVSGPVAAHVHDRIGLRPGVLENGIDRERVTGGDRAAGRAALGLPEDPPLAGLIGRICRQKGIDTFVDAASRLLARIPDVRFAVIGDAEDPDLARRLKQRVAAGDELARRFVFAGHREDMANIYAALDVLAAPSRWEGFGLALAEAMAAGVPVVASNVGGIPAIAGQAARLVPPSDGAALAAALGDVLADGCLHRQLRAAGLRRAGRFDWGHAADKLTTLYQSLGTGK